MNFLRQTPISEQMHSFIKDKNAWENAISMYQGPDPLDHWYNYICWYENHRHGCTNPENQFRQTLERCLSIFEHSDYYKQDVRMVRLWLKYIDMQPNPLHFYQVLHTRGVGKQVAAFYISWASYYESINSLREAEAVYNVAFKEKAQSYAELHHAHSKFLYAHSAALTMTPTTAPVQQHAYKVAEHQQEHQPQPQPQQQPQQYNHQTQQHHMTQEAQQHTYAQASLHRHQLQQYEHIHQPTNSINQQLTQPMGGYRQQTVYLEQPTTTEPHIQQTQQMQNKFVQEQNIYNHPAEIAQQHLHHQQQQNQLQQPPQRVVGQQTTYLQHQGTQPQTQSFGVPVEQQLPATSSHIVSQNQIRTQVSYYTQQEQHQQQHQQVQVQVVQPIPQQQEMSASEESSMQPQPFASVPAIKLPKKFASYSRNNYETWKPLLFLEEPPDPCRQCNYRKQQVYPEGEGIEYSLEELLARNYLKQVENKNVVIVQSQQLEDWNTEKIEHCQQLEQTEERVFQQISSYNVVDQNHYIQNHNIYAVEAHNGSNGAENDDSVEEQDDAEDYEDDGEGEVDGDGEGEDEDEDESDEDEDEDEEYVDEREDVEQVEHQPSVVNTIDDLEDQIEASTIRFSMHSDQQGIQNKTIRIKFKKEPAQHAGSNKKTFNGNYSAYTVVQNIYQQQQQQPQQQIHKVTANHMNSPEVRRNGHSHSFHPYMIGQTSTPKTTSAGTPRNHHRSKLKKVSQFPIATGSSSNSSSADNGNGVANGHGFVMYGETNTTPRTIDSSLHNATFNDNANYSFSSAVALDNSNCSLTSAVDRLNFRDSTIGGLGGTSKLNSTNVADFSTYQENSYFATQHDTEAKERRLQKALATIATHMEKDSIDPFSSELCRAFLTKIDFPNSVIATKNTEEAATSNLRIVQAPLPKLANTRVLSLPEAGAVHYNIDKEVGRGSYGSVYKATDVNTGTVVALKYQKPPNTWEIYICDQVLKRIKSSNILPGLMDISSAIIAPNASLIATEFSPFGSLLDINNKIRQSTTKVMHESLVMHFSAQICNIIHHLHKQKIIHADIKPDNFLLMRVPNTDLHFPSLRLIDFGCAIDMTLFPDADKTKFRKVIQTDGFTCIEMQEGRSWSYETDIFCIAGTVHVMLLGEYMQLQKRASIWDIKQKLPRYLKKHVWNKFFGEILNIKNGKLPALREYHEIFDDEARKMDSELQKQIRTLSNILYRR